MTTLRGLLKRLAFDRLMMVTSVVTVTLAMVLLAAGPIYADAITIGALHRTLEDAPFDATTVKISIDGPSSRYRLTDAVVSQLTEQSTEATGSLRTRTITSGSYEILGAPNQDKVNLGFFTHVSDLENHASLSAGRWPEPGHELTEITLDERSASGLGRTLGETFSVTSRADPANVVVVQIVGLFQIDAPLGEFWSSRDLVRSGLSESNSFRSFPLLVDEAAILDGLDDRVESRWTVRPLFGELTLSEVQPMRQAIQELQTSLIDGLLTATGGNVEAFSEFVVDTRLPGLLAGTENSLTVTRSSVLAVMVQLAVLAGYALVLTAGIVLDSRQSESDLLLARGAGFSHMLSSTVIEGCVLVVPAVVFAPALAAFGLRGLNRFGPLRSIDLLINPSPTTASYLTVGIAGLVTILLLAWPAHRAARHAQRSTGRDATQKSAGRSRLQRTGVDVMLVVLALIGFWQLTSLGSDRTASINGRFGVDPLLVVAPALGLFAGAFAALRVVPLLASLAERVIRRGRSAVPALAGWELARRPARYGRAALLLIMAVAIGIFAASYEATWTRSQVDQATHQVGADGRVSPNRRTNDSLLDLHLAAAHEQVEGVRESMAVLRRPGELPNSELPANYIAINADQAAEVVLSTGELAAEMGTLMQLLAERRPVLRSVLLPGEPTRLALQVEAIEQEVFEEDIPGDGLSDDEPADDTVLDDTAEDDEPVALELEFDAAVLVVLQDGDGLLHRVPVGRVASTDGPVTLTAELAVRPGTGGQAIAPTYPLSIVEVELRTVAPDSISRRVSFSLIAIVATNSEGQIEAIPTDLASGNWIGSSRTQGRLGSAESISVAVPEEADGIRVAIETGSAGSTRNTVPVLFGIRPSGTLLPEPLPIIVTRSWLADTNGDIGDVFRLPTLQVLTDEVEIVGVVEAVPTVNPNEAQAVLVDLPSLQIADYELGRVIKAASEHWLRLDAGAEGINEKLSDDPIEAVSFVASQQRTSQLTTDPPALGAIGSLAIGFLAAAIFAIFGFIASASVSARERRNEFALLRALGLSTRQLGMWLYSEQTVLVVMSIVLGTVIGVTLSAVALPAISLTQEGTTIFPDLIVEFPWRTIVLLELSLIGAVLLLTVVLTASIRSAGLGSRLRTWQDR